MGWRPRLLCCLFLSLSLAALARAATVSQEWEISYQFKSPDCVRKLAVTINGQTPGPTIRATQGDTIVVKVKNSLPTEGVTIHWHGIRQKGTPWADGTEGVTQCPIIPGDTFTYTFVVDRPGTYMYHSHYGMQRSAGLNGMMVVKAKDAEPFTYDEEPDVLLNDWWHKSTDEQAEGLLSAPVVWVGEPQSLLINGRGRFDCSGMAADACDTTLPECALPEFAVEPGKTYRFRIASVTSLSALNFEIEDHEMQVVEADGHYVDPFVVKNLNVYSGETYSVLIKAKDDPKRNYWVASNVISRKPGTPTGTAILRYKSASTGPPITIKPPSGPLWSNTTYQLEQNKKTVAHPKHIEPVPQKADRTILLLNTQNKIENRTKWALNGVSFTLPHTPYMVALKNKIPDAFDDEKPPETYLNNKELYNITAPPPNTEATTSNGLYRLEFGSVVDVVLQNANMLAPGKSETHPWHLHGHDFWVLGFGEGRYDPEKDSASFNLKDPIMKNTVALHPYGWTVMRFKADNPGVWAFHCHIEAHFAMGMGIVFEEGVDQVGQLPTDILGCGKTKAAQVQSSTSSTSPGLISAGTPSIHFVLLFLITTHLMVR